MGNAMCCSDVTRSKTFEMPPQPQPPQPSPAPSPRQHVTANRVHTSISVSDTNGFAPSNHTRQGSEVPPLPSDLERADLETVEAGDGDQQSDSDVEEPPRAPVNWQRGDLLGSGAFGRVFRCMDHDTGELFAVKQVPLNKEEHNRRQVEEYIRTVKAEIGHLSKLKHENIVQYKGTSVTDECLNIFLEYVPGGSVASLLAKFGPFHETVIRIYTQQILLGLEYMHKRGFMHRDIKGANILVDKSSTSKASNLAWKLKLADFGASKEIESLATIDAGAAKSVKGTPFWMAPEIIKQTGHGRPADIWSVGCTIIEMATGKPPWVGFVNSPVSAMFHIASSKDPPPLPEHLSSDALDFLLQCFNRVPTQRPNASTLLRHPFVTRPFSAAEKSPERIVNHIPRAPMPLRVPPAPVDDIISNRSPTSATPPSPVIDRRIVSRRSQNSQGHYRTNSGTVCYSPLTLSKKEGALLQGAITSSKAALSARSKESMEAPLQLSPRQKQPVPRFGVQSSTASSPLKSSSAAKPASSQPLHTDTSANDEPSLTTPKQPDESSYNPHISYMSEVYNPMEEPSWMPAGNQDLQAMLRNGHYSPRNSPRYNDASYRDQDKPNSRVDSKGSSSSNPASGYWSFGMAASPRDESDISTPNLSARVRPKSSRQGSGSDHLRYRASGSIATSSGSSPYSSRTKLRSDLSSSKPYKLRSPALQESAAEQPKYHSSNAHLTMTAPA